MLEPYPQPRERERESASASQEEREPVLHERKPARGGTAACVAQTGTYLPTYSRYLLISGVFFSKKFMLLQKWLSATRGFSQIWLQDK
jgi:hypothetical protein